MALPRTRTLLAAALLAAAASGCGSEDGEEPQPPATPDGAALLVEVRPQGPDGPVERRRVGCPVLGPQAGRSQCRRLGGLRVEDLRPVPPRVACTQIYGGPATARVTGSLRGEAVSARFSLENGCEIARWERNSALLGEPPRRAG